MSTFVLKVIAMVSMLIDHLTYSFVPTDSGLYAAGRIIGRLAMPIYCFLIVEGFFHSKDLKKYVLRLCGLAILSEIPFDLLHHAHKWFDLSCQNVIFTLLLGLFAVIVIDKMRFTIMLTNPFAYNTLTVIVILAVGFLAHFVLTDYGAFGVTLIICMYFFREKKWLSAIMFFVLVCIFSGDAVNSITAATSDNVMRAEVSSLELYGLAAFVPIFFYNGKKGPDDRHLFYLFYPVHLLIIAVVAMLVGV